MVMVLASIRKLVQPLVREMVRQGLSGVKILDVLRGEDLGYRMTNFYSDLRRFTSSLDKREPILATRLGHRFQKKLFEPTKIITDKFEYVVRVKTQHRETGEVRDREAIIDTEFERTRNYVETKAKWYISEQSPKAGEDVIGAEIDQLYYNPEKVW